jgi:hypothetical protein
MKGIYMPSLSTAKLIGAGVGLLILIGLVLGLKHYKALADSRGEKLEAICQATRDASNLPKLKCGEVPAQIGFLGDALNAVRTKTAEAKASDAANNARVEGEQAAINQERGSSYEARIADARARAGSLRPTARTADPRSGGTASVPRLSAATVGTPQGAEQNGLSDTDQLIATEQAIQLDELIKWVKAQQAVDVNGQPR